jgi:hypothetical protein
MAVLTFVSKENGESFQVKNKLQKYANWSFALILLEISWSMEFVVFSTYWIAILMFGISFPAAHESLSFFAHTLPSFLVSIDLLLNRIRFCKRHFIIVQALFALYLFTNWLFVYIEGGAEIIYPYGTWDNWISLATICLTETLLCLAFIIAHIYGNYKKKDCDLKKQINFALNYLESTKETLIQEP